MKIFDFYLVFEAGEGRRCEWLSSCLDDVIFKADVLLLLPGAVLDVEDADEVSGPASQEAVEDLESDSGSHPHLGEGVGQRQQNLSDLQPFRRRKKSNRASRFKKTRFFSSARNIT